MSNANVLVETYMLQDFDRHAIAVLDLYPRVVLRIARVKEPLSFSEHRTFAHDW